MASTFMANRNLAPPLFLLVVIGLLSVLAESRVIEFHWHKTKLFHPDRFKKFAAKTTFVEGDVLKFKFNPEHNSIVEVRDHNAYETCDSNAAVGSEMTSGEDTVPLTAGKHYFISKTKRKCDNGQKLEITVAPEQSTILTAPAPAPAPSSVMKSGSSVSILSATVLLLGAVSALAFFFLV